MSATELAEKVDKVTHLVTEIKSNASKRWKEQEEHGHAMHETLQKQDNMLKDLDKKFKVVEKAVARNNQVVEEKKGVEAEIKSINDFLISENRTDGVIPDVDTYEQIKRNVDKYIRKGENALTYEERKSINGVIDPDGGYLVAPERATTLRKRRFDGRAVAINVLNTTVGSNQWKEPFDDALYDDGVYEDQLTDTGVDQGNNDFKETLITVGDQYFPKKFSRSSLEDSFVNLDTEVMNSVMMGMERKNADGVLNGLGTTESPLRGILTYPDGTGWKQIEQVESAENDDISFDDVLNGLPAVLQDDYHANASYAMRRQTFFRLIISKDMNDRYQIGNQIQFFSTERVPLFILGYPVLFDAGMPAIADGALSVLFGDLEAGYRKVNRLGFGIHRNESDAKFLTLTGRTRVGGDVIDFRALKLLRIQ